MACYGDSLLSLLVSGENAVCAFIVSGSGQSSTPDKVENFFFSKKLTLALGPN
jgi:hypothetical protein